MPQLTPFFFFNQTVFVFILLTFLVFLLSKYILPRYVNLFIIRLFLKKL